MDRSARRPIVEYALSFAAIAGLCLVLYQPALDAPFLLDDWDNIVHNPYVHWTALSLDELSASLVGPRVRRPVANVSFGLSHYLSGADPGAFRRFNLLIHALNGLLVCGFTRALLVRLRRSRPEALARIDPAADRWLGLAAGLLFVAHPLQIQAVTYVVQRMTSFATFFYLAAILLWLRRESAQGSRVRIGLAVAAGSAGLLALGAKEIAIALPAALWLVHGYFVADLGRDWWRRSLPFAALAVGVAIAALAWASRGPGWELHDFGPWERLLTQPRVLFFYLSLIAFPLPVRLNLLHEIEPSRSLIDPVSTLLALVGLALLLGLALVGARRFRFAAFALCWFFLHSALEASSLPLRMIFEHRLYLPLVGFAVALPVGLVWGLGPRGASGVAIALIIALGLATHARNEVWGDASRLRLDSAQKSPTDWLAQMMGASALAEAGQGPAALAALERVIALEPASPRPHNLRGAILRSEGHLQEALAAHERAIALDPSDAVAYAEAARAAVALGELERAAAFFESSLVRSPDGRVLHELGDLRARQGDLTAALALYEQAAQANPRARASSVAAGRLLAHRGDNEAAAARFAQALALGDDAEVRTHLANALWAMGRGQEAVAQLELALRAQPDWPVATNNLAWMLATSPDPSLRDPERALALVHGTLAVAPADWGALDTLAAAHAAAGRFDRALEVAERAARAARAAGAGDAAVAIEQRASGYARGRPHVERPATRIEP
jgi:tetratricopeptide (TPR) repeat protein